MLNIHDNNFRERKDVITNLTYSFAGYNRNAEAVYSEYITEFSIACGVITDHEPTGRYLTEAGVEHQYIDGNFFAEM